MASMEPLRAEHRQLLPHIAHLGAVGGTIGSVPETELVHQVDVALEFLRGGLLPHAAAEDAVLYPVVDALYGGAGATATMRHDHAAIVELVDELDELRRRLGAGEPVDWVANDLRRVLYGLFALIRVHFAKEEEIYVPFLESRLTAEGAAELLGRLHETADDHSSARIA